MQTEELILRFDPLKLRPFSLSTAFSAAVSVSYSRKQNFDRLSMSTQQDR